MADPLATDPFELSLRRPAPRRVLADEVYEILRESLLSQRIAPGARLNLDQLARELHVSNTPVRQALARLEADGLVTKEPYIGFTASPLLDSRTIEELYDLRLLIEPAGAGRAAKRGPAEWIAKLEEIVTAAEGMLEEQLPEHAEALGNADAEFHLAVASAGGNGVIVDYLGQVLTQMSRYTLYSSRQAAHHAWEEHRTVLEAIERGDSDEALKAMRAHLRNGWDRVHELVN
ncbi:GntR family transcriptional regulator [Microbacterium rhizosphaerae]|uniref:GntR family transcriptional regulator n=1 Tax=Microbacterium rhizosphaerae TaxID=1678237 RepID=A0ABZ0SKV8_9MICO|nr:GntR family transcriptional regulator [Microbacterium rhizosphaerae]WPR89130.1 GntR family transcriptional regulator [Microbacterium rhizosphaerae]